MPDTPSALFTREARGDWLRLRTFILLRWIAITGQIIAIAVAQHQYHLRLELGLVYMAVGAAIIANLLSIFLYPENKRLSETQALWMLLFDLTQLSVLIFLTGGLHNPFALLIVVPVTISATALSLRPTLMLGLVALAATTLLAFWHIELRTEQGFVLRQPDIFLFGFWLALVIGILFLGAYARRVSSEIHSMGEALLATQMALSREQKLTDLGGVVAAAAHELGTPLATIRLVSTELIDELADRPDLREDAELIGEQADRCREIMRSMGRAGKDDAHLRTAPLSAVIEEAAEPHLERGKTVHLDHRASGGGGREPQIYRQPEVVHGLRNLIQNAVDFANANVWAEARWTETEIRLRIADDGKGYPQHLLGRIGDPFVRRRRGLDARKQRPEYEGMGLGLFIAKTLLERSGAELSFANGSDPSQRAEKRPDKCGAIVEVVWPRGPGGPEAPETREPLGKNQPIVA